MDKLSVQTITATIVLLILALVPWLSHIVGQDYYITFLSRILIFAIAAVGLNLILGFGGLISLGHGLYIGLGVYIFGILANSGITNGWIHLGATLAITSIVAIILGIICLRTSGMAFIMITLAFGQMAYYVMATMSAYGGDDGMAIPARSDFGLFSFTDNTVLYMATYVVLLLVLLGMYRLVHSPFGLVLQAIKLNRRRMSALGYPTLRYQLAAYVLSAAICALAGILLANLALYMSPSYMQWHISGELVMIIVLGGMASVIGPVYGALVLLLMEEALVSIQLPLPEGLGEAISRHPMVVVGIFVVLVAIGLKDGLHGLLARSRQATTEHYAPSKGKTSSC